VRRKRPYHRPPACSTGLCFDGLIEISTTGLIALMQAARV
jgi:hypothetical protein